MKKEDKCCIEDIEKKKHHHSKGSGDGVYWLGVVGALVYYLQLANTFKEGLLGIFKAIFWPAFLIHKILTLLGM